MKQLDLIDKVFTFTQEKSLFSTPCHILVGLSGGADSMALLYILTHWPKRGLRVSAMHIHHGLRGELADRDEAFVRRYCVQHNVPLKTARVDVMSVATEQQLSIEEAGRKIRYELFETERIALNADYIVTAHTATDQVETVLMHIIRGCGMDGLAGIPCRRGLIRRPLLCCDRQEIEAFCAGNSIPFVTDETNFDTKYTRNDLRHRVLPLLREINPSVDSALLRLSKCAAEESAYLNDLALDALQAAACNNGYRVDPFLEQDAVVRRRMIRYMLREHGVPTIEEAHILAAENMLLRGLGDVDLPGGFVFSVRQNIAEVRNDVVDVAPAPVMLSALPCKVTFSGVECSFAVEDYNAANVHNLLSNMAVDYDKIQGELCLRCRRVGDYFHAAGRGVGKSLKKWMNEWHIPAHKRDAYPVLCDEVGVVLVPGYACDERVRITEDTKHFLVCRTDAEQG